MHMLEFVFLWGAVVFAVALALTLIPDYRAWLARRLGTRVGLGVPADLAASLEARVVLRNRAACVGALLALAVSLAGLVLAGVPIGSATPRTDDGLTVVQVYAVLGAVSIGYSWGAAWASLRSASARDDRPRVARLTAPGVSAFVRPALRIGAWALLVLAASAVAIVALGERPDQVASLAPCVALVGVALAGLIASEVLGRRVVRRGRPAVDTDELVWDDALRSETLRDLLVGPLQSLALGGAYAVIRPDLSGVSAFALFPALIGAAGFVLLSFVFRADRRRFLDELWPGARRRTPDEEARRIAAAADPAGATAR